MQVGREARRALVGVILATSVLGVALAQEPVDNEHSYSGADCYGCHKQWSPVSMRTMFNLRPMETEPAAIGNPLELGMEVQQAWYGNAEDAQLTHFEASVDIAQAPSLGFLSQDPPVLGVQSTGTIEPPSQPIGAATGYALIQIPAGTSELVLTLAGNSTDPALGPDLAMVLHPGRTRPGSSPYMNLTVNDGGRGEPERLVISGNGNVSGLGGEPFAVEAILMPTVQPANRSLQLEPRTIDFTVTMDAYRNTTGETQQYIVVDRIVEAGASTIIPFQLLATRAPAPGEQVRVTMNVTAFYAHDTGGGRDDFGNLSKSRNVAVVLVGDRVTFQEVVPATTVVQASGGLPLDRISEAVGYLSAFLLISSIVSGGMFGAASRRAINHLFHTARRRIAFHNFLSYFLMLAAAVHTVLFIVETNYEWTLGIIWGGLAILAMLGLGITGAWQVHMIRRWDFSLWKWTHYGLAVAAIVFTIVHGLLDGAHFGPVQDAVGWDNPFPDPRDTRTA